MEDNERIVYSINVEDLQTVANEEMDRNLNSEEIKRIEDKIGDHIAWYESIADLINEEICKTVCI